MRRAPFIATAVVLVTTFLGCATTGEIPVAIDQNQAIYISPANADGVQDAVTFDLVVTALERTRIVRYQVAVTNASGTSIYTEDQSVTQSGFFARLFGGAKESVTPPAVVLWDGRNDEGEFVPDDSYTLEVSVWDNNGNTGSSGPREVVVDNTPPSVAVSAPYTLFTPNGDDRLDVLSIYQRRSTREDTWMGRMINAAGQTVKTFTWQGGARDFTWDGTADGGPVAAEGTYTYTIDATDLAGNTGTFTLSGIVLERNPRPAVVSVNRPSFSPNGDGHADTIGINPRAEVTENLTGWHVEIRNITGDVVRSWSGTGVPTAFNFDGLGDDGSLIPDGIYRAVLSLAYSGGQTPETASNPFTVDTAPPQATVRVSSAVFSPDGDGSKDTVEVLQSSSDEKEWTGTLTGNGGSIIRTQNWSGRVSNFVWDGTDATGTVLPDGTYTYTLTSVDDAENTARPIVTRVKLDTRPTPVRITSSSVGFSPNGDGIQDSVSFALGVTIADDIDSWSVALLNGSGTVLGTIASGTDLPESISWDGRVGGGTAADGQYVTEFRVAYDKGNVATGRSSAFRVDTTAPTVVATFTPPLFSPDDDGLNDQLTINLQTRDVSPISRWEATLYDPADHPFVTWTGTGAPQAAIKWDGYSESGELVQSAEDYRLVVTATDAVWNAGKTETTVPIDILVIREGDRLRIRISSIYFVPYTADYTNLDPAQASRNLATLDRLAAVLKKYPQHSIRVEGHAVQVLWDNPARALVEQNEVLLPLSLARADAIKRALVQRGIDSARMTTAGYGGAMPVVPHSDLDNRWKNRRVEFILERK